MAKPAEKWRHDPIVGQEKWRQAPLVKSLFDYLKEDSAPLPKGARVLDGARQLDAKRQEKAFEKLLELRTAVASLLEELRAVEKQRPTYEFEFVRNKDGFIQKVIAHPR
ncbi:MAG: hypothetical protein ACYSR5_11275 [Planctomycetota bacterium]|jgi:hypothetical protein